MIINWKKSLSVAALIATIAGGIVAAWPFIEPNLVATRGYAREIVNADSNKIRLAQSNVEHILHSIQLDTANGKLEATNNDLFKAQLEMKKASDPNTQEFIIQQINKLQATKSAIESQIQTLHSQP